MKKYIKLFLNIWILGIEIICELLLLSICILMMLDLKPIWKVMLMSFPVGLIAILITCNVDTIKKE